MKKLILLASCVATSLFTNAQLILSGSSYTQNFDGIATGLPTGWNCYIGSSATSLGSTYVFTDIATDGVFDTSNADCASTARAHGFKNYPSADVIHALDTCGTQIACTNRAFGVRQVSPSTASGFDSGAAFVLEIGNTSSRSAFNLSFKLQSLDITSDHLVTWRVDYGIGAVPTVFTPATTTGYMVTGGGVFSDTTVTVNFGTALDNKSVPVWIRVVTLQGSTLMTGATSGYRPSSAIDDFHLTYTTSTTGISNISTPAGLSLGVVSTATPNHITLTYSAEENDNYSLSIYDITGRVLHSENINALAGIQRLEINGLNLTPGMYFAKMSNSSNSSVARIIVQ